ncbi:MAG: OmpP1/FadL family transporter [Candidatus Zhuqueibacterota bacterium]
MLKPTIILMCILLIAPLNAIADIPAAFVDIGYGARPMGMAGAFVALANDANSVLWNPAGLSRLNSTNATFMWAKQFNLIPYYFFSCGRPMTKRIALGGGFISSGNDALRETTGYVSFAYRWSNSSGSLREKMRFGLNIKFRHSVFGKNADGGENQIKGDAFGMGLDLGWQWTVTPKFVAGALLRDVISPVNYQNTTLGTNYPESVPPALIVGGAVSAYKNLLFSLDWEKTLSSDNVDRLRAGLEYSLLNIFVLRAGVNQPVSADINRKYAVGLGLLYSKKGRLNLCFDFAYEFFFLANTPKISTTIWF